MQRPSIAGTAPVLPQHNAPNIQTGRHQTVTAAARNICQSTIQCLNQSARAGCQFAYNTAVKLAFGVNTAALFFSTVGDLHDIQGFKYIGGYLATTSLPIGLLALRADMHNKNNQDGRLRQINDRADNVEHRLDQLERRVSQHLTQHITAHQQAQQPQASTNSRCVIS